MQCLTALLLDMSNACIELEGREEDMGYKPLTMQTYTQVFHTYGSRISTRFVFTAPEGGKIGPPNESCHRWLSWWYTDAGKKNILPDFSFQGMFF